MEEADSDELAELKREVRDLEITNRVKDLQIERMEKDCEKIFQQLVETSRTVGQLETKLLGLEERTREPK